MRYPDASQAPALVERLEAGARALPGVISVGTAQTAPLTFSRNETGFSVEGRPAERNVGLFQTDFSMVTPGYFEAIGMRILKGRGFDASDRAGAAAVAMVNETLARKVWPGEDPVGKVISFGGSEDGTPTTDRGTGARRQVQPAQRRPGDDGVPCHLRRCLTRSVTLLVRTAPGTPSPAHALAGVAREADPYLPIVQNAPLRRAHRNRAASEPDGALRGAALRDDGLAAGGGRVVRAARVRGEPPEAGDRDPHGARRHGATGAYDDPARRDEACRDRPWRSDSSARWCWAGCSGSLLYGVSPLDPLTYVAIALLLSAVAAAASAPAGAAGGEWGSARSDGMTSGRQSIVIRQPGGFRARTFAYIGQSGT